MKNNFNPIWENKIKKFKQYGLLKIGLWGLQYWCLIKDVGWEFDHPLNEEENGGWGGVGGLKGKCVFIKFICGPYLWSI